MTTESDTAHLIRCLALLAGAITDTTPTASPPRLQTDSKPRLRSCIDGGSELMVGIDAPGGRAIRVLAREQRLDDTERIDWAWWRNGAQQVETVGARRLYLGEPAGAWAEVAAAAGDAKPELRRWHARLGTQARLYSLTTAVADPNFVYVGWQLDRHVPIDETLRACGLIHEWRTALPLISELIGHEPSPRRGPWAIAIALDGSSWRLGTSSWARVPEDSAKRTRLLRVVAALGGDVRFTEATYKLLTGWARTTGRIGRAVEIEFPLDRGASPHAEFFLGSPVRQPKEAQI
jgi:hypothetical protein